MCVVSPWSPENGKKCRVVPIRVLRSLRGEARFAALGDIVRYNRSIPRDQAMQRRCPASGHCHTWLQPPRTANNAFHSLVSPVQMKSLLRSLVRAAPSCLPPGPVRPRVRLIITADASLGSYTACFHPTCCLECGADPNLSTILSDTANTGPTLPTHRPRPAAAAQ